MSPGGYILMALFGILLIVFARYSVLMLTSWIEDGKRKTINEIRVERGLEPLMPGIKTINQVRVESGFAHHVPLLEELGTTVTPVCIPYEKTPEKPRKKYRLLRGRDIKPEDK